MSDPRLVEPDRAEPGTPYDPLRLCIFATVALLGWVLGPLALAFFAGLGIVGYARARRAGLLRSKCLLGDTRNVLGYLGLLAALIVDGENGRGAAAFLSLGGLGFSVWLTYVEVGILDAICIWCVGSAICMALLAALATTRLLRAPAH